jgi:carbon starvation protein
VKRLLTTVVWTLVALAGAVAYVVVATQRKEPISAAWILIAAVCTYSIGYRFYGKWIAANVFALDDHRATPAEIHEDGRDFVRTNRWIVLGHHFAAISGPGPLVGPVLAAQFGYLPGAIWIPVGVVLAGAVQDFVILIASMRRDGRSLAEMVKDEISGTAGFLSLVAILSILVILISVLGLVVVKALAHSPWGTFTILATMPIAIFMGLYLRYLRPGRVLETSAIGVVLLLLSVYVGRFFHEVPALSRLLTFDGETLAYGIIAYGLAASALPVWLLLAPRDYLSTFMKLGTISALALGIVVIMPNMAMPALTRFIDGQGPVFAGNVFPFCFITIACGAISGFHSLISSGTTPKLVTRETHTRSIGYGSMLLESTVAIMALIAAGTLEPGVYFAINSPAAIVGHTPDAVVSTISSWGFPVTAAKMSALARELGETSMFGRAGGAPTLAVGMAEIFSRILGGRSLLSLWYHFAIMFEALFILTTIDAGTRVGRFLLQAFLKQVHPSLGDTRTVLSNMVASVLLVAAWGYFLLEGVIDPLGGINTLWPLFGIANQLLSVIALCLATTILLKMGYRWRAVSVVLPLSWVTVVTFAAAFQKLFSHDPKVGFLAAARALERKLGQGDLPGPSVRELSRTIFNLHVDAVVAGGFLVLVGAIVVVSITRWTEIVTRRAHIESSETPPVWLPESALVEPEQHGFLRGVHGAALVILGLTPAIPRSCADVGNSSSNCHCMTKHKARNDRDAEGRLWAARETARFGRPRCC